MQAIAIGLTKMSGKSAKTGNQYEMHKISIMIPSKNASTASFNKLAFGYEPMDLDVQESAFPKLSQLIFPCALDLTMDHEPRGGKVVAVVSGFNGQPNYIDVKPAAKAAA